MKINRISAFLTCAALTMAVVSCRRGQVVETEDTVVRVRMEAAVATLNPLLPAPGYSRYVAAMIFQTLGILDPESLELKPLLLENIPAPYQVADGPYKGSIAYELTIIEDARWDNGTPVSAEDVLFTLKLIHHPSLPTQAWRGYFEYLQGLEINPANPRKFTVYNSRYYMLALESLCQIPIYPAYHYDPRNLLRDVSLQDLLDPQKAGELAADDRLVQFSTNFQKPEYANDPEKICGSGAYRLAYLDGDQGLVLEKKENWWGDEAARNNPLLAAYPKRLEYRVVKDEAALENMLRNGELDIAVGISPAKFVEWQKDSLLAGQYAFETRWTAQYSRWILNNANPKLQDVRVRRALAHIVDYDYMIRDVQLGLADRIIGPINPAKDFFASHIKLREFDLNKAKALLAEAGWSDSDNNGILDQEIDGVKTELTLDVLAGTSQKVTELLANSLRESAEKIGIRLNIIPSDINRLSSDTRQGQYETALIGAALYPGLVELYQNYHSASLAPQGDNRSRFINPVADSLIEAIRTTENPQRRRQLYFAAQQLLHDETPDVFLYAPRQRYVASKRFRYVISSNRPGYYEQLFRLREPQN